MGSSLGRGEGSRQDLSLHSLAAALKDTSCVSEFLLRDFIFYLKTKYSHCELCVLCRDAKQEERGSVSLTAPQQILVMFRM